MALIFTACVFLFVGPLKVFSADKFYIYEWPQFINRYANFTDRPQHSHGVEFPLWTGHYGAGRLLSKTDMEYKTSQFGLFKIMYERALIDPRRTLNPNEATSFLIPYDFGMDATFFEAHGRMRKTSCPLATEVRTLLEKSIYFKRHKGHDHTMIVSVNQNMNYFFHAQPCLDILMSCWNCTKISIDEYIFIGRDRNYELKNRGINWHAVPYPSDYHYDDTLIAENDNRNSSDSVAVTIEPGDNRAEKKWRTWFKRFSSTTVGQKSEEDTHKHVSHISPLNAPYIVASNDTLAPWERVDENRSIVVSFLGNPRKFSKTATWIREALAQQCGNHTAECLHGSYKHEASGSGKAHAAALSHSSNLESRHSVFCLQPPGDIPTRKIVFDSILSGCIPVLFHPLTAKYMYEWHFTQAMWDDIAVHFDSAQDNLDLITHKTDFIAKLIDMYRHNQKEIARKRQLIRELAFSLQYSLVYLNNNTNTAQVSVLRNKNIAGQGNLRGSGDRMLYDAHHHIGQFDAYDVTMSRILAIHSGRETHNRTSDYLLCAQIPGGEKIKLQTSDYCNSTHSAIDPFFPPSVQSPLYKGQ